MTNATPFYVVAAIVIGYRLFRFLNKRTSSSIEVWPANVPHLYPNLNADELSQFLSKEEYFRIRMMRRIIIVPFYDSNSSEDEKHFGIGLQKLMIRDLRLHRDISVLGPEDSPSEPLSELGSSYGEGAFLLGGTVRFEDNRYRGYFYGVHGESVTSLEVEDEDFLGFVGGTARGLLSQIDCKTDESLLECWKTGRPATPHELIALGQLNEMPSDDTRDRFNQAVALFRANPHSNLPLHAIGDETEISLDDYLLAFARDPYDVQLLFLMHNKLWTGEKGERVPFQFIRRAIELAPGHGKAHMVVTCSAPETADIYYHCELGYRLLPGNGFAVNNYMAYLLDKKLAPPDLSIAYEGAKLDPYAIQVYWQGIELLKRAGHLSEALGLALQLKKVVTPPLQQRTIYWISQNPVSAAMWKAGTYNPLPEVDKEIANLQAALDKG